MRYAFCNEMFGNQPFEKAWSFARGLGYTGVEIAPFTLGDQHGANGGEVSDVREITAQKRRDVKQQAADAQLEVVGLHWLLAKTAGFYLTSPDAAVRRATAEYFTALAELCRDLGGGVMVLGSPQQRNLLPGVSYEQAEQYAAEVLRAAMPACEECGVTIALEPLGPAEGDFLLTARQGEDLMALVDSPCCQLHLDVKAMSSEALPFESIIKAHAAHTVHFHANDENLLGPGMGDVEFGPILQALKDTGYDGWISVEAFKYEPSPEEVVRQSIEYLQKVWQALS